jgi:phosphoribosylanthranilate isomerase
LVKKAMWVKICANTNIADALLAAELGADAVGFVFAPSKRQVTMEQVAEMTRGLPARVERVGVFTSVNADEMVDVAAGAGLTMVQLHCAFDASLVEAIHAKSGGMLKVLQVVDVAAGADADGLRGALSVALRHPYVVAVLLDASHGGASGGTGKVFDWKRTSTIVREAQAETEGRIIVAGGLRAENVGAAIAAFKPWGVDVASGVEASYGVKDPEKLRRFIAAARGRIG